MLTLMVHMTASTLILGIGPHGTCNRMTDLHGMKFNPLLSVQTTADAGLKTVRICLPKQNLIVLPPRIMVMAPSVPYAFWSTNSENNYLVSDVAMCSIVNACYDGANAKAKDPHAQCAEDHQESLRPGTTWANMQSSRLPVLWKPNLQ